MLPIRYAVLLIILFAIVDPETIHGQDWKKLFDLRGKWKFEIGDSTHWARPEFDDRSWETIHAPAAWEDEGYPGYDGFAWYRKHFQSDISWDGKSLALHMGVIDDVDEVFLNGHLVGATGRFPPEYSTAYSVERIYSFPTNYLNPSGDNVVAVRVYDAELSGGILRGKLGVYEDRAAMIINLPLALEWKFKTGDNSEWKSCGFGDHDWDTIEVPSFWERQGYSDYDGFAWYRSKFYLPNNFQDEKLILVLGKIDDFDETFLNGQEIGHTGSMQRRKTDIPGSNAYQELRAYYIPSGLLHPGAENCIAVRVYDGFRDGGIYEGPLGITTRDNYLDWQKHQKKTTDWFDKFFR